LVTFGVVPNRPETGYGYIRRGDALGDGVFAVSRFVEKPDLERAEQYLADGHYLWNSGMFLFRADAVLAEFARWQPEMLARCREALAEGQTAQGFTCLAERPFTACRSVSFDYAVMEMTTSAAVVPADIGWNDVGSWAELWSVVQKDAQGNFLQGDVVQHDGSNNYLRSEGPLLAAVGVENLVIVATSDAVLVCRRDAAQDVKKIVDQLRAEDRPQHVSHRLVKRPWGSYEGLAAGNQFQVKHIIVNPGASLSLQLHHRRSEHWTVVSGQARVTRDSEVFELPPNQSVYIPSGVKHRLENVTDAPLHVIEVQCGSYLGEDDIVRFQDIYGR
jgi:mannose-1-phosphate guanylyltransferase/mannose-6-phosphate isomerase